MRQELIFQKLLQVVEARGAEEPPPGSETETEDDDDDEDLPEGEEGRKKGQEQEDEGDKLLRALKAERKERKKFERELKQLRAAQEEKDKGDQGDAEKARTAAQVAQAKADKLAARLVKQAVDMAITKAATSKDLKFKDPEDALLLVQRDLDTWVDQDPDDPSEIEVDEAAVAKAVKALAARKPHLLEAEGEQEPSGSKFGGRKNDDGAMTEDKLREKYPALRRTVTST